MSVFITKNDRNFNIFSSPEFGSNLMYHNSMRLWHTSQNDKSHEIVTHQVETKF